MHIPNWVPGVHPMPKKGRRAAKAVRAREEAPKAKRRMGEVLRGKELTEVKEFAVAHSRAQTEREDSFRSFLDGEQVTEEIARWCKGQSKLQVALDIMSGDCVCGVIKWRCNCGMFWGDGETQYPEQEPDQREWDGEEDEWTEDEEDEFLTLAVSSRGLKELRK